MSETSLDDLKVSLRIDGTNSDDMLTRFIETAESFIKNAINSTDDVSDFVAQDKVKPLFETAVIALASVYYEYRSAVSPYSANVVNLSVNAIIGQLRGLYDTYSERGGFCEKS
ncbi:head-tail connector protein [Secundilactobacillus kimchicus]|uniref:head-tail connector protein n=1 Tax=Secundilactobacillus kimchicus TaxID=528209 RepID=UPI0024A80AB7|nr:head-tail connector protein [Secundilactobacillus kimchicus]